MNYDSTYINKKHSCYLTLLLGLQFLSFVSSFNTFSASIKENHIRHLTFLWEHVCFFCFVLLICWTSKRESHFLLFKKKKKSLVLLKPIVSSLLSFSCKTASIITIYVQWTSQIYDVIWIYIYIYIFFFTQLNMLRKMVLLIKRGCWQFWEFLLL